MSFLRVVNVILAEREYPNLVKVTLCSKDLVIVERKNEWLKLSVSI
jgi:hypothetical protein